MKPIRPFYVYIAGPYEKKAELQSYIPALKQLGLEVCSRWLTDPAWPTEAIDPLTTDKETCANFANKDLSDVLKCKLFIQFSDGNGRGGRNVELGFALGLSAQPSIAVIGPPTTIFHHLLMRFETFDEFMYYLSDALLNGDV